MKNSALAGTEVTGNITYYAIWKDTATSAFWLSSTNTTGTQVSDFTSDTNYRTGREVIEDVGILREGSSNVGYDKVLERWNTYYSNDVKLYATYAGGANETMYDGSTTSALNGLVEFRIMEVSGEAGHMNTSGDASSSDGSVVTFMATHVLPTAEQMNTSNTSVGGWNATAIRSKLQVGGEIYNKFPTALTSAIKKVNKLNNIAGGSTDQEEAGTTTNDAFWFPSYSELYYTGTYSSDCPKNEGTTYKWCQDKNISGDGYNTVLRYKTRSSGVPGSNNSSYNVCWWERSPAIGYGGKNFLRVDFGGIKFSTPASEYQGVAPAFCF